MATNINNSEGGSAMGFIVGGLVVLLVILGIFYFSGNMPGSGTTSKTSISVQTPSAPAAPSK
ncbi:MAG: hypothetical protein V4691_05125 [Pseudomonadota bacterium]